LSLPEAALTVLVMTSSRRVLIDATSTPLASIFGSGFLVIVPILNGVAGPYSVIAMLAVLALASVALSVSNKPLQKLGIVLIAAVLAFITLFAVPAG